MARRLEARDLSLDTKVFDDGQTTLVDTLESNAQSQEESFAATEERGALERATALAPSKRSTRARRYIVEARMMADEEDELSLAEIGRRLGVSRERARQLESRVKKKLRAQLAGTSTRRTPRANTRAPMGRRMNTLMETGACVTLAAGRQVPLSCARCRRSGNRRSSVGFRGASGRKVRAPQSRMPGNAR